jgi:hypothetical protein
MKRWQYLTLGFLAIAALISELVIPPSTTHEPLWWEKIPYFFGIFGFIGCVAIILISKFLGKFLLLRKETYYDEP